MALPVLDNRAARRLFLDRHRLLDPPAGPGRGADLLALIRDLGFVQVDSINTLARAHDMILFARRPAYRPAHLRRLYERDRALFEHWTHDAAILPMEFFPHWQLRFERDAETLRARWRTWQANGFEGKFDAVLRHIRDHGPVTSADLGGDEAKGSGGWWDWHPSKAALEFLWRSGALTVIARRGFQKVYDLTERAIDARLRDPARRPDPAQTADWLNNAALDRLGFATSGEIAAFWDILRAEETRDWCAAETRAGRLEAAEITGADGRRRRVFLRPGTRQAAAQLPPAPGRMRVLSPFDPLLRDRARAERLFGFRYRIEVFVPAAKRVYGYYVFPLLEGAELVGRIDMKAARDRGCLAVAALWPEPGRRWGKGRQARLEAELARVARFAGLDRIEFANGWLRPPAAG